MKILKDLTNCRGKIRIIDELGNRFEFEVYRGTEAGAGIRSLTTATIEKQINNLSIINSEKENLSDLIRGYVGSNDLDKNNIKSERVFNQSGLIINQDKYDTNVSQYENFLREFGNISKETFLI